MIPSRTTRRLHRALTHRHTPAAKRFWEVALGALTAGTCDPDAACAALLAVSTRPAADVRAWLSAAAEVCGARIGQVLAHLDVVERALAELDDAQPAPGPSTRTGLRALDLEKLVRLATIAA